jgi:hypothetical protein
MKYFLLMLTIGVGLHLPAQTDSLGFLINFYFEDAIGNKDTVYVGGVEGAHPVFNPQYGEVNLLNEPFDSVFEVRAGRFDELFDTRLSPTYIGKTIISNVRFENPAVPRSCQTQRIELISFIVHSLHPPLTVSWDNSEEVFDNPYLHCLSGTLIINTYAYLSVFPWWTDAEPGWTDYTCLRDDRAKEFFPWTYPTGREELFQTYYPFPVSGSTNENDSLEVYPLKWSPTRQPPCGSTVSNNSLEDIQELPTVFPNPVSDQLHLKNLSDDPLAIFSLDGREVLSFAGPQSVIDVSGLPAGIYFLRQVDHGGRSTVRKFIKQ